MVGLVSSFGTLWPCRGEIRRLAECVAEVLDRQAPAHALTAQLRVGVVVIQSVFRESEDRFDDVAPVMPAPVVLGHTVLHRPQSAMQVHTEEQGGIDRGGGHRLAQEGRGTRLQQHSQAAWSFRAYESDHRCRR